MKESPSRGLPLKTYLPIVIAICVIAGIPIAIFLHTGFGTTGSALGVSTTNAAPPPMIANALAKLRARIARNPKDLEALETLAGLEVEAGRREAAAGLDAQAVAIAPKNARIRAAYAEVLNDLGHGKAARAQVEIILKSDPQNPDAHYERGIINEGLGDHTAAEADFQAFLAHASPKDPRRAALLGRSGAQN